MAVFLIADDDVLTRMVISEIVIYAGHAVIEAEDPYEAIRLSSHADAAFLDVHYGADIDGFDVADKMSIPFSFVTGNADAESRAKYKQTCATSVVFKPFDERDISAAITQMLANAPVKSNVR